MRKRKTEIKRKKRQVKKDVSQTKENHGREFKKRRYGETETAGGTWLLDYPNKKRKKI